MVVVNMDTVIFLKDNPIEFFFCLFLIKKIKFLIQAVFH